KINRFVIETIPSTQDRQFEISNIHLRKDEPEFNYERQTYVDDLGQLNDKQWTGKTESIDLLKDDLQDALQYYKNNPPIDKMVSQYGGWKELRFKSTGFFRTEFDGTNWWFVDPE